MVLSRRSRRERREFDWLLDFLINIIIITNNNILVVYTLQYILTIRKHVHSKPNGALPGAM